MSLTELLPTVKNLTRADKLRLMQLLIIDLAHEEGVPLLVADAEYSVWTPLNAFEAAHTLAEALEVYQAEDE